jgi:hypothetical protein
VKLVLPLELEMSHFFALFCFGADDSLMVLENYLFFEGFFFEF